MSVDLYSTSRRPIYADKLILFRKLKEKLLLDSELSNLVTLVILLFIVTSNSDLELYREF